MTIESINVGKTGEIRLYDADKDVKGMPAPETLLLPQNQVISRHCLE
jgi:hypothetical protein